MFASLLVDVNECNYVSCPEHADCHDTDGSYFCKCQDGYWEDENNCTGQFILCPIILYRLIQKDILQILTSV